MTLWLADKRDLHSELPLSAGVEAALRNMAAGGGDGACQDVARLRLPGKAGRPSLSRAPPAGRQHVLEQAVSRAPTP